MRRFERGAAIRSPLAVISARSAYLLDSMSIIIGVAGGSGSGKTTVVRSIVRSLGKGQVTVVHHDSYYRDASHLTDDERHAINYDHPDALETELLVDHLEALRAGQSV